MRRTSGGSRAADVSRLRELTQDDRWWVSLGLVVARDGNGSHWEVHTYEDGSQDVLVDVDLVGAAPAPALCRLGSQFGGPNIGAWRVPSPGTEVLVVIPAGEVQGTPVIAATLATGAIPGGVADGKLVVVSDGDVVLTSTNGTVQINGNAYSLPKWDSYMTAFKAFITTLKTAANTAAINAAAVALDTAITTDGTDFKSSKAKNG